MAFNLFYIFIPHCLGAQKVNVHANYRKLQQFASFQRVGKCEAMLNFDQNDQRLSN